MSWLFSRVLVEASLQESSSDGGQSVQSSGTLTLQGYCAPDKMMDFLPLFRFGMTYALLTETLGGDVLTWCLEDSLVRICQSQDTETDWTEKGLDFGERCPELLGKYDPDTHSWKIAQTSLIEDSPECLQTLPRWGMTHAGALWGLTPWVRPTKETECGFLERFPTPNAWDGRRGPLSKELYEKKTKQITLVTFIRHSALTPPNGGQLNPSWVEWLMGWMPGWTDLKPLETDKSPCVLQPHGKS